MPAILILHVLAALCHHILFMHSDQPFLQLKHFRMPHSQAAMSWAPGPVAFRTWQDFSVCGGEAAPSLTGHFTCLLSTYASLEGLSTLMLLHAWTEETPIPHL